MTAPSGIVSALGELADPYDFYDELRGRGRVLWIDELDRWLVTGHAATTHLLRHPLTSSDRRNWDDYQLPPGLNKPPGGMFSLDPPSHTRLRSLVARAFSARLMSDLRPRVEALVDTLLDEAAERGTFDLMNEVAYPLPAIVLADLLGVPTADRARFQRLSTTFIDSVDPVSHQVTSPEGSQAYTELSACLTSIIDDRRRHGRDDLITGLVRAEEEGDRLTGDEVLEMCLLLVVAGLETTANLIGNAVNALFAHPARWRRLCDEPGLLDTAVEELARFDAPIQLSGRVAMADIEVEGRNLHRGQMVGLLLGAANRDPDTFARPHDLILDRRPNHHVSFGRGIHFCLGAPLALRQAGVALAALGRRFPDLAPAGPAVRRANVHVRGFATMPVAAH